MTTPWRQPVGLFENFRGLAVAEPARVADAQRHQIGRVRVENIAPDREGAVEPAAGPGRQGGDMQPLALARTLCAGLGRRQ